MVILSVPKGTKFITLSYLVGSAEYPTYVLQNSRYNDFWSIRVSTPNHPNVIPLLSRRVNSQISLDPKWLTDGTTGIITQEIDVSKETKDGKINVVLTVSSTNVGDSILDTVVTGELDLGLTMQVSFEKPGTDVAGVFSLPVNPPPYAGLPPAFHQNDASRK